MSCFSLLLVLFWSIIFPTSENSVNSRIIVEKCRKSAITETTFLGFAEIGYNPQELSPKAYNCLKLPITETTFSEFGGTVDNRVGFFEIVDNCAEFSKTVDNSHNSTIIVTTFSELPIIGDNCRELSKTVYNSRGLYTTLDNSQELPTIVDNSVEFLESLDNSRQLSRFSVDSSHIDIRSEPYQGGSLEFSALESGNTKVTYSVKVKNGQTSSASFDLTATQTAAFQDSLIATPGVIDTDGVKLIDPIVEGPPMNARQASRFRYLQVYRNWGIKKLGLDTMGMKQLDGSGSVICIADTGQPDHSLLVDNIGLVKMFVNDASPLDANGHSTHVAGIIKEIAPSVQLPIAKVLSDRGYGSNAGVASGIVWCKSIGAHGVNLSLGSSMYSSAIHQAGVICRENGVELIAAAGNDGPGLPSSIGYPARDSLFIGVGSIDRYGVSSPFSSTGPEGWVSAPGQSILSTYLDDTFVPLSGTSMAAPFVSGMLALWVQAHGTTDGFRDAIARLAVDAGPEGFDDVYFHGIVSPAIYADTITNEEPVVDPEPGPVRDIDTNNLIALVVFGIVFFAIVFFFVKRKYGNE